MLQRQIPCEENERVINNLRSCLWEFEKCAAERHGRASVLPWQEQYQAVPIEEPTCAGCGHVGCEGNHKSHVAATTSPETPVTESELVEAFAGPLTDDERGLMEAALDPVPAAGDDEGKVPIEGLERDHYRDHPPENPNDH